MLAVEDAPEMCAFIRRQVSESYSVITAGNGVEALELLEKSYVNVIISDIMIPKMDGFEFCRQVKSDLHYSHIPLILLSVKTNLHSKISGMNVGADAYVEKPFSSDYLLSVIVNLIKSRQMLSEAFSKPAGAGQYHGDLFGGHRFHRPVQEIIQANLSDPAFKINDIAEMVHMSCASFYRMIKGVLNMTPNDYLRRERLKIAARLLWDKRYRINEVCYMVGFGSTSYFAKCFQKQFGVLPKKYASE